MIYAPNMQNEEEIWGVRIKEKALTQEVKINAVLQLSEKSGMNGELRHDLEWGFPYLEDPMGDCTHISFSHTENRFCALLSKSFVGIDIENADRSAERLIPRIFTDQEMDWSTEVPAIQVWCAKEAILKALGVGLRGGLKNVQLIPLDKEKKNFCVDSKVTSPLGNYPTLHVQLELWEGYWIAIAAPEKTLQKGTHWL